MILESTPGQGLYTAKMGRTDQLADFERFDFESSEKWKAYLNSVEVTSTDPAVMRRLKGKWYSKNIDVNFDLSWLASKPVEPGPRSSSFTPGASSNTSSSRTEEASRPSAPPPPPPPSSNAPSGTQQQEQRLFMYHGMLVLLTVAHLATALISPFWSFRAHRMFMQLSIMGQVYKLYLRHGVPRIRPWSELQMYLARVVPSNDFHFFILGVMFLSAAPSTLAMLPNALAALWAAVSYGATRWGGDARWAATGGRLQALLTARQRELAMGSAGCEVAVGGSLVLQLLSPSRNFLLLFAYWNLLKMRYLVSEAAPYHRQVWYLVDRQTAPLRARVPILQQPIAMATRWFTSLR